MKDKIIKWIFILGVLFILYVTFVPYIFIEMWNVQSGGKPFIERVVDKTRENIDNLINRNKYNEIIDEYIEESFGVVSKKFAIVEKGAVYYIIKFDEIMDKNFTVYYNKEKKICGSNFYEILSTDPKFQHLYSEWVKKQVGIEDGDVELKIGFSKDNINFNGIISLSEDCHEIFENINRYEVMDAYIKNVIETDESSLKEKAEYYYNKLFINNVNNKKYYIYLIEADCDFKIFMNNRSGNYYSCCFENKELSNFEKHN